MSEKDKTAENANEESENPPPADGDIENNDIEDIEGNEPEQQTGPIAMLRQKLKFILAGVGIFVLVGVGVGVYFSGLGKVISDSFSGTPRAELDLPELSRFHDMPVITVDLKPSAKRARPFIRLVMTVEVYGEAGELKLAEEEAKILDAVQTFLRDRTVEELSGQEGTKKLRKDLLEVVNHAMIPEKAITVLFKEILVR
ncbi:MAG: flagellar basal body-associated FliL family protein [Rhodospirillaceae bacterium]|nr:flagellar basal body-associated FliL family protein [Rhodospirillaceae bacterium]